jgi:hypothetical protein
MPDPNDALWAALDVVENQPFELSVIWLDSCPIACVHLVADQFVLARDELLYSPVRFILRPPARDHSWMIDFRFAAVQAMNGPLGIRIRNRVTGARVDIDITAPLANAAQWSPAPGLVNAP